MLNFHCLRVSNVIRDTLWVLSDLGLSAHALFFILYIFAVKEFKDSYTIG